MAAAVDAMDKPAVSDYLYQMIVSPSSGDRALSLILKPGAFAHQPLADRLPNALVPTATSPSASSSSPAASPAAAAPAGHSEGERVTSVPVIFVYGVADWMDRYAGASTAAAIIARGGAACSIRVKNAGHQLNIDNPRGFKECVEAAMSFPSAEAGQASRQQWMQSINATHKHLIVDT